KHVPWFRHAFVEKVACQVGVRETRHIRGRYRLTQEDIINATKFEDGIARSRYFIDIHNPKGAHDVQQKPGAQGAVRKDFGPPEGDYYEVPFRSLIAKNFPNLIVACRGLSATHEAAAAVRVMATMHAVGEAAGIAAAAAAGQEKDIHHVDGTWVERKSPICKRDLISTSFGKLRMDIRGHWLRSYKKYNDDYERDGFFSGLV